MDRHGVSLNSSHLDRSLRGIMTHSRIEDLVDAYIVSKQEYIIVDVAPNGTTNRKLGLGEYIRGNCEVIFGKITHGYKVYNPQGILIFEYQGGISQENFAILGICPAKVDSLLSGKGLIH